MGVKRMTTTGSEETVQLTLNGDCAILEAPSKCSVDLERAQLPCIVLGPLPPVKQPAAQHQHMDLNQTNMSGFVQTLSDTVLDFFQARLPMLILNQLHKFENVNFESLTDQCKNVCQCDCDLFSEISLKKKGN